MSTWSRPILSMDAWKLSKNRVRLPANALTRGCVRWSLNRAWSEVMTPRPTIRFTKYEMSKLLGDCKSIKVLRFRVAISPVPPRVQYARSCSPKDGSGKGLFAAGSKRSAKLVQWTSPIVWAPEPMPLSCEVRSRFCFATRKGKLKIIRWCTKPTWKDHKIS